MREQQMVEQTKKKLLNEVIFKKMMLYLASIYKF